MAGRGFTHDPSTKKRHSRDNHFAYYVRVSDNMNTELCNAAEVLKCTPAEILRLLMMRECVWQETGMEPGHVLWEKKV